MVKLLRIQFEAQHASKAARMTIQELRIIKKTLRTRMIGKAHRIMLKHRV